MDKEKEKLLIEIALDAVRFAFIKGCNKIDGITMSAISSVVLTSKISDKVDYIVAIKWATDIFIQEASKLSQSANSTISISN